MSLRRTPLYHHHVALGGKIVPFAGFELPVQYPTGTRAEHLAVRSGAGLFDVSHMGEIRFRGPQATAAVSWLVTGDVAGAPFGSAKYHAMCNADGGIVDDVYVYRMAPDEIFLCVNAANREKDIAHIRATVAAFDVAVEDEGDQWSQVAVQGPAAVDRLAAVASFDARAVAPRTFTSGTVADVAGCLVARTGYTGEDGFEVFAPNHGIAAIWEALVAAGATPCGLGARDTLRLEARNALYGHELTDVTTPWQAGLGWIVDLDKEGGFLGRDALVAKKGTAPRRLVALVVDDKRIPRDGMDVKSGDAVVGVVTSGTFSPSLERGIALAYVDKGLVKPGTSLTIDVRGKDAPCTVIQGSFLDIPRA
jgi:aminomethyltransferase